MDDLTAHESWVAVLDRMEHHVALAEQLADHDGAVDAVPTGLPDAWEPPDPGGPLPEPLLPRARELHRRQLEASAALGGALTVVRGHRQRARRSSLSGHAGHLGTSPATATYVDVSA